MQTLSLQTQPRDSQASARDLRSRKIVPCVLYGNDIENTLLQCDAAVLRKLYAQAGESSLVQLEVGGSQVPVLFHDVDVQPVSGDILHVDFYAVNMKKEVEAHIPLRFVGEAPAVKDKGGVFVHVHDHVWVKCLPANLPHDIEVDISVLADFQDAISVADLSLPSGVTVTDDPETVVAVVQEPRAEEPETVAEPASTEESAGAEAEKTDEA